MSEISRYRSDPSDDRDFQQFAGVFDRPIAPAPTFAESLRRQVAQSPAPARADRQPANARLVATGAAVTTFVDRRPRRIGFSILEIAAALLLVSALALSAYLINAVGRPIDPADGDDTSRLAHGAASPVDDGSAADVNWGGDPGRSWYFGDAEIDASVPPLDVELGASGLGVVGRGLIVGDSWYGWTLRNHAYQFRRVDLQTNQPVWTRDYRTWGTWGTLASDGQRIFTSFIEEEEGAFTRVPVAIDMRTGDIVWQGPPFAPRSPPDEPVSNEQYRYVPVTPEGPLVLGETVFIADGTGTTMALNARTGEEIWRYQPATSPDQASIVPDGGLIVGDQQAMFVTLPDESIAKLDPASGRAIQVLDIPAEFGSGQVQQLDMQLSGDSLVVSYRAWSRSAESTHALVFDARDLSLHHDVEEVFGPGVLSGSSLFIFGNIDGGAWQVYELNIVTGDLSEGFGGGRFLGFVQLSASGDTLIALTSTGSVFYFSMETHELVESYRIERSAQFTPVGGPAHVVDGQPIVVWLSGDNSLPYEVPVATPAP